MGQRVCRMSLPPFPTSRIIVSACVLACLMRQGLLRLGLYQY